MGRPKKAKSEESQIALIDVEPENQKIILRHARAYLKCKEACGKANETAKKKLNTLRESIEAADLKPVDSSGKIQFRCGDEIITWTPKAASVSVKHVDDGAGAETEEEAEE